MAKKGPKESRPLMLRRSQWEALRDLVKAHGCVPDKIVEAFIEVHPGSEPAPDLIQDPGQALRNFAPKLDVHLAHLKRVKP